MTHRIGFGYDAHRFKAGRPLMLGGVALLAINPNNPAGLREDEDIFASVWNSAKNRWLWLAVNLCTAFFASRVIDARGDRWEGYVVVIAINVLVVHLLARALYSDRTPSVPIPDLSSTTALIFVLLTTLFLANAVKQAVVLWQYRR